MATPPLLNLVQAIETKDLIATSGKALLLRAALP